MLLFIIIGPLSAQSTIKSGAQLETVYVGTKFFEGLSWDPAGGKLYFTTPKNSPRNVYRLDGINQAIAWMTNAPMIIGMFTGVDGRLLTSESGIGSYLFGPNGPEDGKTLAVNSSSSANDLCQTQGGDIYFTSGTSIYHMDTAGKVSAIVTGLGKPNGIITSLDDSLLYVSESTLRYWLVYPIKNDGSVGEGSIFTQPTGTNSNTPDGMTIDQLGNLYCTGLGGLYIFSPEGEVLDFIEIPELTTNVEFGGPEQSILYISCQDKIYSLETSVHAAYWSGGTSSLKGDVNKDGKVTIVDSLLIAQRYVGIEVEVFDETVADVDCSGAINIVDSLLIAQLYVGLLTALPC